MLKMTINFIHHGNDLTTLYYEDFYRLLIYDIKTRGMKCFKTNEFLLIFHSIDFHSTINVMKLVRN